MKFDIKDNLNKTYKILNVYLDDESEINNLHNNILKAVRTYFENSRIRNIAKYVKEIHIFNLNKTDISRTYNILLNLLDKASNELYVIGLFLTKDKNNGIIISKYSNKKLISINGKATDYYEYVEKILENDYEIMGIQFNIKRGKYFVEDGITVIPKIKPTYDEYNFSFRFGSLNELELLMRNKEKFFDDLNSKEFEMYEKAYKILLKYPNLYIGTNRRYYFSNNIKHDYKNEKYYIDNLTIFLDDDIIMDYNIKKLYNMINDIKEISSDYLKINFLLDNIKKENYNYIPKLIKQIISFEKEFSGFFNFSINEIDNFIFNINHVSDKSRIYFEDLLGSNTFMYLNKNIFELINNISKELGVKKVSIYYDSNLISSKYLPEKSALMLNIGKKEFHDYEFIKNTIKNAKFFKNLGVNISFDICKGLF